ncbi:hypothetical protein [Haladaptatus salinisoli]|uniref:hypothetical protein n=1 Tax=Haladaptatus salinisoli TaxID=2884876 RepID=UPI001D0AF31A|nr:hypothetical protein [Haladaptatus salinisoli]
MDDSSASGFPAGTNSAVERVRSTMKPDSNFTDEQVGKRVVAADGTEVGVVDEVRNGSLYVEVGPDADPGTLDELRWDGVVHQSTHELQRQFVADVREDVVRLSV